MYDSACKEKKKEKEKIAHEKQRFYRYHTSVIIF